MIHSKRWGALLAPLAILCSLVVAAPSATAQCLNGSQFGGTAISAGGAVTTISTCSWAGEFSPVTGAVAGMTLRFTSSVATDYITVRAPGSAGAVLAHGPTPLTFVNTFTGTVYPHWNTSAACGTQNVCRTTTVQCTSCVPVPPPANNNICNAVNINCGDTVVGTNVGAIRRNLDIGGVPTLGWAFVWYKWTAPSNSCATFSLCASSPTFDSVVLVLQDPAPSALPGMCWQVPAFATIFDDDGCSFFGPSTVTFGASAGSTYFFAIRGFNDLVDQSVFTASLTCVPAPINDVPCAAAELLPGVPTAFDVSCASADAGEAVAPGSNCDNQSSWCPGANFAENSLWYRFTVPASGCINIGTSAGGWDGQLAVYQVANCGDYTSYSLLAANDDGGAGFEPQINQLSCLSPGTELFVQLDGYFGAPGSGTITLTDCGGLPLSVDAGLCQTRIVDDLDDSDDLNYLVGITSGGVGGVSYVWTVSSGDQDSIEYQDGASAAVSPDEATLYCLTATDSTGCSQTDCVSVDVISAACGNRGDKMLICHSGNGNNPHEICIDPCGVEAHLGGHDFDHAGPCDLACNATNPAFPPPPPCVTLNVDVLTDLWGNETLWSVTDETTGNVILTGGPYPVFAPQLFQASACVDPRHCYTATFIDLFGDGICCFYGAGQYTITFDGTVVATGGAYGAGETTAPFGGCAAPAPAKSGAAKSKRMPEVSVEVGTVNGGRERMVDVTLAPMAADPNVLVELVDGNSTTVLFQGAVEADQTYRVRGAIAPSVGTMLPEAFAGLQLHITSSTGAIEHKTELGSKLNESIETLPVLDLSVTPVYGSKVNAGLHGATDDAAPQGILRRSR